MIVVNPEIGCSASTDSAASVLSLHEFDILLRRNAEFSLEGSIPLPVRIGFLLAFSVGGVNGPNFFAIALRIALSSGDSLSPRRFPILGADGSKPCFVAIAAKTSRYLRTIWMIGAELSLLGIALFSEALITSRAKSSASSRTVWMIFAEH
jgi:hypothetical protein